MPKVTVGIGLNMELNKGARFDRFTPSVMIADIDTDGNVDAQIKASLETGKKVWSAVSKLIQEQCTEELERPITIPSKT